jgi:L-fuculokinase
MSDTSSIAILDIGKTNKKLFLFDEKYRVLVEQSVQLPETKDEDGFPCEDVQALSEWVVENLLKLLAEAGPQVKAINSAAYGASFVCVDQEGIPLAPLYNYLKPYPDKYSRQFYDQYGGEDGFSRITASPVLGSLNSGMQLYRLKYEQPQLFKKIHRTLHLPQYISSLITAKHCSDISSIGCHTGLWNFRRNDYHEWVNREGLRENLAPILPADQGFRSVQKKFNRVLATGIGLHDSSAALIPYQTLIKEPFVLISTGTWCISLNPFNHSELDLEELRQDCLCYLDYLGRPVKASRLFAGYEHEEQTRRMALYFQVRDDHFSTIPFNGGILRGLMKESGIERISSALPRDRRSPFAQGDLSVFKNYDTAYHQLMLDIVCRQFVSTGLVLKNQPVKKIYVDGGFSKNSLYMHMLSMAFSDKEVYAVTFARASAVGAAMAIQKHWNRGEVPADLISFKIFEPERI